MKLNCGNSTNTKDRRRAGGIGTSVGPGAQAWAEERSGEGAGGAAGRGGIGQGGSAGH
jgi:hypothetical protein